MCVLTKYYEMIPISKDETLLVNMLTSALDIIDEDTKKIIEDMKDGVSEERLEKNQELCVQLKERGYIFSDREEEQKKVKALLKMNQAMSRFKMKNSYTICPTMGCNLSCTYCFESDEQHKDMKLMTEEQLQGIFKYIREKLEESKKMLAQFGMQEAEMPASEIKLFGGEPLLQPNYHLIELILAFAKKNGLKVKIITNGTTVDYYMELLKEYTDIIGIQITLDGGRAIHNKRRIRVDGKGTYDVICENIDKILKNNIEVALRINVDRENVDSLGEIKETISKRGWEQYQKFFPYASPVQCFTSTDSSVMSESEFLEKLVKNGYYGTEHAFLKGIVSSCIGYLNVFFSKNGKVKPWKIDYCEATSGSNFCFAPDGTISTCLTYIGKGNLNIGTFNSEGVYFDEKVYDMWFNRNVLSLEKCRTCKYAFICGGGCPVAALETNGDINDVVCSDIQRTLKMYVKLMKDQIVG